MTTPAEHIAQVADQVTEQCREQRLRHTSPDGSVGVVVDGNGGLIELTIAPGTLRGAHPQLLANRIGKTVNTARQAAVKRQSALFADAVQEQS
jgi:DNA-binding protein YbaB